MVMGIENEAQAVAVGSHPVYCDWEVVCFDSLPTFALVDTTLTISWFCVLRRAFFLFFSVVIGIHC